MHYTVRKLPVMSMPMQNQVCGKNVSACQLPIFAESNAYILENEVLWHDAQILHMQLKYGLCIMNEQHSANVNTWQTAKNELSAFFGQKQHRMRSCETLVYMTISEIRTPSSLILNPTSYPLGHIPPMKCGSTILSFTWYYFVSCNWRIFNLKSNTYSSNRNHCSIVVTLAAFALLFTVDQIVMPILNNCEDWIAKETSPLWMALSVFVYDDNVSSEMKWKCDTCALKKQTTWQETHETRTR